MTHKKLNIGCGTDIRQGWVNLDKSPIPGVDVIHDIESIPLPFPDEEFDTILCQDILEHVEYIPVLREVHRILKNGGRLIVRVPHFTSRRNYSDPTHKKMFSLHTFDFFVRQAHTGRDYYFDFHFDKIEKIKLFFEKKPYVYNYPVEWCINANRWLRQRGYEATFLSRLFPAENIYLHLIK